jgi:hypothetical protein
MNIALRNIQQPTTLMGLSNPVISRACAFGKWYEHDRKGSEKLK